MTPLALALILVTVVMVVGEISIAKNRRWGENA